MYCACSHVVSCALSTEASGHKTASSSGPSVSAKQASWAAQAANLRWSRSIKQHHNSESTLDTLKRPGLGSYAVGRSGTSALSLIRAWHVDVEKVPHATANEWCVLLDCRPALATAAEAAGHKNTDPAASPLVEQGPAAGDDAGELNDASELVAVPEPG
jgi:hypothetical protein